MQGIVEFFRRNPQAFVLLVICVVLGVGTFIAILIAIASSPTHKGPGYPNGLVTGLQVLATLLGR
jgi:hypothetical protein